MSYGRCVAIVRHWQILTTIFAKNSPPVRRSEFFPIRHHPAPVTTTDATFRPAVRCSGHIDRCSELSGYNPADVFKLMANNEHFLAMLATARFQLIQ